MKAAGADPSPAPLRKLRGSGFGMTRPKPNAVVYTIAQTRSSQQTLKHALINKLQIKRSVADFGRRAIMAQSLDYQRMFSRTERRCRQADGKRIAGMVRCHRQRVLDLSSFITHFRPIRLELPLRLQAVTQPH